MPSQWIYFQADGSKGGDAKATHLQATSIAAPGSLFVYGGDVYDGGSDTDFGDFDGIYSDVRPQLAAIPGNHDWLTEGAQGYEKYWLQHQPPESSTPIDTNQSGPNRHHYSLPLGNGWLGVFIDCGKDARQPLTVEDLARFDGWLTQHGTRRVIVFLHHARLSHGQHENNAAMDPLWTACFNSTGAPRVVAWVAGHNHDMGVYSPRTRGTGAGADPPVSPTGIADGVQIFINGAGGTGHYTEHTVFQGTFPDAFFDMANFGFLQIELSDSDHAVFQNYSTGTTGATMAAPIGPEFHINL